MYGQMTAGSWIYIGSQGIVQGTYETFVEAGRQHYGGDLAGRWILTGGLGGMGGAQPLAATMAGASMLAVECQTSRIEKRLADPLPRPLDRRPRRGAGACSPQAKARRQGRSRSACSATPPRSSPRSCGASGRRCTARPDMVTDQTSRPRSRSTATCRPAGRSAEHERRKAERPEGRRARRQAVDGGAGARDAGAARAGHPDARLRQQHPPDGARRWASRNAFDFPGFVPAYIRPLFCRGIGPFRWAALSGDPEDIYRTDARVKELIPDDPHLHNWLDMARERIAFQGLPARICWVGLGQRHRLGLAFNEMVAKRRGRRRRSSSAATISIPARSPRPTARPRR